MPFVPLIKMPSNASRYSSTCLEHTVRLSPSNWPDGHVKARGLFQYLHLILSKNAIENEVSPEHRPLTFNVLKQLQLCGIVVQPRRILEGQRSRITAESSSSDYIVHNHSIAQEWFRKLWPLLGSDIHPWWSDSSHNDPEGKPDGRDFTLTHIDANILLKNTSFYL